jgi:hypothetical protein
MSNIRYLQRKDIDEEAWNLCIDTAENGLIYAYTYYLDAMCTAWDALVLNDYEAVMPLPSRKKWGISYLYYPGYIAQLGLFGKEIPAPLLHEFLNSIPRHFRYWDFPLNYRNVFSMEQYPLYERNNFVLHLGKPYSGLYTNYRDNLKRNIKKAVQYGCNAVSNVDIKEVSLLAKDQVTQFNVSEDDIRRFEQLFYQLHQNGKAISYGVYSSQKELLASCAFVFSHKRAFYILVGNHPNGRTLGASHLLIDSFIKDYAATDLLLDFEGSDLRSLAFFYNSFGAVNENYTAIRMNNLPWYARWMKRP